MSLHLQRRIEHVKRQVLTLGGLVEQALRDALRALEERDADLAATVIAVDGRIDALEIELEEDCLATLALEQPVAFDLRFVVGVLKMNNDLERLGDIAANVAQQARFLAAEPAIDAVPFDLPEMQRLALEMVTQSLDAFVNVDLDLADRVRRTDDRVDDLLADAFRKVEAAMRRNPAHVPQLVHYLNVARMLERVADHAANIAEDVVYLGRGEIVRHELKLREPVG